MHFMFRWLWTRRRKWKLHKSTILLVFKVIFRSLKFSLKNIEKRNFRNILIISFIIILTILLAAFVLNLLNYLKARLFLFLPFFLLNEFKKRYSKLRRPLRDLETGENYPLNDITNNFPEYMYVRVFIVLIIICLVPVNRWITN